MQEDVIVPVVMFIAVAFAVSVGLWMRFRVRAEVQQTIRAAIDRGHELTPELLEGLANALEPRERDVRRGVVSVGLAVAVAVFAVVLGDADAVRPMLGIAAFPLVIGMAFLLLAQLRERSAQARSVDSR